MKYTVDKYKNLGFYAVKIKIPHNCDYVENLYKQARLIHKNYNMDDQKNQ